MRKKLILGVLVGTFFLFFVSFSVGYPASFPRHKNPAQIQEETFFPTQLISLYGRIVSLQAGGKWDKASSELKKTLLGYIPEPLRYIFNRFNQLIQDAGDKLKVVKEGIDSAEGLLYRGETEKAGNKLEDAWMILLKAERDLSNLNSSVDELRGRIGDIAAERLRQEIAPLGKLANDYKNKIQNLYGEVKEGERLESTFLQISVSERNIVVGDSFEIYGKLKTEEGKSLAGRKIDIFLEEERTSKALTHENGEFRARIDFPFLYKRIVPVFASFIPEGEDKERLYYCTSNEILLESVFYTPQIKASYQEPVYPVLPFKIQGELTLESMPLAGYPVKIQVGQKIIQINTDEEGEFQAKLSLPAAVGKTFPLSILTPSRGIIGPASFTINLPVTYKTPSLMVDLPLLAFSPFSLDLEGEVSLEGEPMKDATVRVIGGAEDVTTALREKSFKVKLNLPLSRFSGWERMRILLHPQEAWISSLDREAKVLVVNPLTLLPFIGLLAVFISIASRRKKEMEKTERTLKEEKKVMPEKRVAVKKELTGLARIYTEAVVLVAGLTGIQQSPEHTIREYLDLIKNKLEEKESDFELISFTAEKSLYALRKVSEKEEKEAEEALKRLKK